MTFHGTIQNGYPPEFAIFMFPASRPNLWRTRILLFRQVGSEWYSEIR